MTGGILSMPRKLTSKRVAAHAQTFEHFDPAQYPNLTPQQREESLVRNIFKNTFFEFVRTETNFSSSQIS